MTEQEFMKKLKEVDARWFITRQKIRGILNEMDEYQVCPITAVTAKTLGKYIGQVAAPIAGRKLLLLEDGFVEDLICAADFERTTPLRLQLITLLELENEIEKE